MAAIKDVAKWTGVSPTTVSHVLTGKIVVRVTDPNCLRFICQYRVDGAIIHSSRVTVNHIS